MRAVSRPPEIGLDRHGVVRQDVAEPNCRRGSSYRICDADRYSDRICAPGAAPGAAPELCSEWGCGRSGRGSCLICVAAPWNLAAVKSADMKD